MKYGVVDRCVEKGTKTITSILKGCDLMLRPGVMCTIGIRPKLILNPNIAKSRSWHSMRLKYPIAMKFNTETISITDVPCVKFQNDRLSKNLWANETSRDLNLSLGRISHVTQNPRTRFTNEVSNEIQIRWGLGILIRCIAVPGYRTAAWFCICHDNKTLLPCAQFRSNKFNII